jgi:hypothetical protein
MSASGGRTVVRRGITLREGPIAEADHADVVRKTQPERRGRAIGAQRLMVAVGEVRRRAVGDADSSRVCWCARPWVKSS